MVLPLFHIKFELIAAFKAAHMNEGTFQYLCKKFPRLSIEKITKKIFIGSIIRQQLGDTNFKSTLISDQLHAWCCFRIVSTLVLWNRRAKNYRDFVDELIHAYKEIGCNMTLNLHFFYFHLDVFLNNCGALRDEYGERFH